MRTFLDANLLIYLNTIEDFVEKRRFSDFYLELLREDRCYIDALVLDEVLFVSKKKYAVPYELTCDFISLQVLPYVDVLPLAVEEYTIAAELVKSCALRPSDALHVGAMRVNNVKAIASEDVDFDSVDGLKRVWIQ